ncbi:MAG TPA: DNA repair protein [Spirochaetia bacterium]|nr:DNA repair protein [Spirochaetia bacterium]
MMGRYSLDLPNLFEKLIGFYGPQGWWPLRSAGSETEPDGYHRGDYSLPATAEQRFEIVMGAVLTQNTAWANVRTALARLLDAGINSPSALLDLPLDGLRRIIKPSGYYNQKARKLREVSRFLLEHGPDRSDPPRLEMGCLESGQAPRRERLLDVWGVGEETADSILLYAFGKPVFVVDTYTRRIFARLGLIGPSDGYRQIQRKAMEKLLPSSRTYNECHALLVRHAKEFCRKSPKCGGCPLRRECPYVRRDEQSNCLTVS